MTTLKHQYTKGLRHGRYGDDTSRLPPVFLINPTTCSTKGISFPDVVDNRLFVVLFHCNNTSVIFKLLILSIIRFSLVFTATISRHLKCCIVAVQQCNNFNSTCFQDYATNFYRISMS